VKLDGECLNLEHTGELIRVIGANFSFEFRQRSAVLKNVSNVEAHSIRGGRRKVVYVKYHGVFLPCPEHGEISEEISTEMFAAHVVKCAIDTYVTMVFSGLFLVDYVVISKDLAGLVLSGKREVYTERVGNEVTVYFT